MEAFGILEFLDAKEFYVYMPGWIERLELWLFGMLRVEASPPPMATTLLITVGGEEGVQGESICCEFYC